MSTLNKNITLLSNMKHNTPMYSFLQKQKEEKFVVRLENINDTFRPFGKTLNGHANLSKTFRATHQNNHKALTYGNRIGAEADLETMIEAGMSNTDILKQGINTDLSMYELAIFKDGTYDSSFTSSDTSTVFNGDKMVELVRTPSKSISQNRGESHRK